MEFPLIKKLITSSFTDIGKVFSEIVAKFKADPTKVIEIQAELEQAQIAAELKAKELNNQLEEIYAKQLESVNQTMREESKSEHFLVWSWRPLIGYTFCAILVNNYILLPYLKRYGMSIIEVPSNVWEAILVILGVASAGRAITSYHKAKK